MGAKNNLEKALGDYGHETNVDKSGDTKSYDKKKKRKSAVPSSRQGKRHIAGYFDPAVLRQLKGICAEEETTIQALLAEGFNAVFVSRGKAPIA